MFPIILHPRYTKILLVGDGALADKRTNQLVEANFCLRTFKTTPPTDHEITAAHIVYIVDYPPQDAEALAARCRTLGTLVNVEDVLPLCDFHTPALLRRGDLLLSISTNGKSPALAVRIKKVLEKLFPHIWSERLDILAEMRLRWRNEGLDMKDVARKTGEFLDNKGWLDEHHTSDPEQKS